MRLILHSARGSRHRLVQRGLCVALACAAPVLHATTYNWQGVGFSNAWEDTNGNWDGTYYPGYLVANDKAVLPAGSQRFDIKLSTSVVIDGIDVGAAYVLNVPGQLAMNQGVTGSGLTLNVSGSAIFNSSASAGNTAISVGAGFGYLAFLSNSTAGTAAIDSKGHVSFEATSTGANATVLLEGGTLDVSNMTAPLTLGSLHDTLASPGTVTLGTTALSLNSASNQSFYGSVSGTGSLNQMGAGALTLAGSNSGFSGALSVQTGELQIDGDFSAAPVTVDSGGTLSGGGRAGAVNLVNGTLAPGSAAGVSLRMASVACSVAEITFDLDTGTRLVVDQNLAVAQCPQWHLTLTATQPIASGQSFDVATLSAGTDYVVANIAVTAPSGYTARAGFSSKDVIVTVFDATDEIFGDSFD